MQIALLVLGIVTLFTMAISGVVLDTGIREGVCKGRKT